MGASRTVLRGWGNRLDGAPVTRRSTAEENYKTMFGHYPQRVEFPESDPDPALDAAITRLFAQRRYSLTGEWPKPRLRKIDGGG
jgi:hypothetical protein